MASPSTETGSTAPHRQNALAEIQFASIVDSDLTPSEDETPDERELQLETVQSAIGVSIGQQQTHLTSPNTPAAEKAAALEDSENGGPFEGWEAGDTTEDSEAPETEAIEHLNGQNDSARRQASGSGKAAEPARLPSPWRAGPKKLRVDDRDHRSTLRDSFAQTRRRALSGGATTETLKKYINFNLPSMPKTPNLLNFSLPSFSVSSFDYAYGRNLGQRKRITSTDGSSKGSSMSQHDGTRVPSRDAAADRIVHADTLSGPSHSSTDPIPQRPFGTQNTSKTAVNTDLLRHDVQRRPTPSLRRSNSEGSLLLYRQKSIASSLGDDSRFEHVQEQVNSRLKALKDSWQDSNFKLPSMPNMPNFSFGSREDFFKSTRNSNPAPRTLNPDLKLPFFAAPAVFPRQASARAPRTKEPPANVAGMSSSNTASHPFFTQALQNLEGDIVILGGYRGSILRSAEPPNRQLWVPIKVGLNLRKVDLELGLNPEDEETEEQRIIPGGMLTHIGPVDIAKRLLKRLRASENAKRGVLRVHNYGYDWRLSPHILSRRFIEFLKSLPCNQPGVPYAKRGAIVVAHSLGGLITRHAINQHPDLVAGVVYAGVPQTCVNILGPLRNGDDVLLSSRVLTAQVNFTIRTSYALLPLDGKCFINKRTKEEYPVDFFDINTWSEYRLSPCIAPALPHPNSLSGPNLRSASGIFTAMSQALPSLPGRRTSTTSSKNNSNTASAPGSGGPLSAIQSPTQAKSPQNGTSTTNNSTSLGIETHASPIREAADVARNAADKVTESTSQTTTGMTPQMHSSNTPQDTNTANATPGTTCTITHSHAVAYLTRTLAEVKRFKLELAHNPEHEASNAYPPIALIYGKSTPTVYGARVESREAIKRADAYDELAFASGDGVVLARAAMVPEGYSVVRGGVVSSDRGHVTLLGDLEAVGRCLTAVIGARANGVGLGEEFARGRKGEEGEGEGKGGK